MLEQWSSRQLQELYALFAVQAEERGDLPPPPPDDEEPDPDDPPEEDLDGLIAAEVERVKRLKGTM